MTEQGAGGKRDTYSKDYWDLVLGQLKKRKSVRVALALLVGLYAVAIFAPLLANDRPLYFEGTNYGEYRAAHRLVTLVAGDLLRKVESGEKGFVDWEAKETARGETLEGSAKADWFESRQNVPKSYEEWINLDRGSLSLRLNTMRRQLAPDHYALLDRAQGAADTLVAASLEGDSAAVKSEAELLSESAAEIKSTLKAAKYGKEPEPGKTVALQSYTAFPVLESVTWQDAFFMVLWTLVILFPLWNRLVDMLLLSGDRARIRKARRKKFATVIILSVLGALGWIGVHGSEAAALQATSLKEALSTGKAEAVHLLLPPVEFGMAEQNQTETFRPPTWSSQADIDAEGYYMEGARSHRIDEATGTPLRATPVDVRVGESDRNDPMRHVLGTDSLGRDMLGRMIWGGRISLAVGIISTVLLVLIGTLVGSLAGYFGGWTDILISRVIEVFQCFPVFFLILLVVSFLEASILNIMLAIGIFRWTGVARLVRAEFIRLRGQDFVVASQALGMRSLRTIFRHVLPNALGPVLVAATFAVASGILTESALSFLGFGVKLPVPSWGSLLVESKNPEYWWIQIYPGLLIFVTVILYNLVGEGVRDALDPRLKEA
ncbi:MAG: ABC transporter permease [Planctomycetota bacterium]|jgi:peptide/nickel transport system permease protein|nr:ABC transporter permease [Planctomycetota bacterium]